MFGVAQLQLKAKELFLRKDGKQRDRTEEEMEMDLLLGYL